MSFSEKFTPPEVQKELEGNKKEQDNSDPELESMEGAGKDDIFESSENTDNKNIESDPSPENKKDLSRFENMVEVGFEGLDENVEGDLDKESQIIDQAIEKSPSKLKNYAKKTLLALTVVSAVLVSSPAFASKEGGDRGEGVRAEQVDESKSLDENLKEIYGDSVDVNTWKEGAFRVKNMIKSLDLEDFEVVAPHGANNYSLSLGLEKDGKYLCEVQFSPDQPFAEQMLRASLQSQLEHQGEIEKSDWDLEVQNSSEDIMERPSEGYVGFWGNQPREAFHFMGGRFTEDTLYIGNTEIQIPSKVKSFQISGPFTNGLLQIEMKNRRGKTVDYVYINAEGQEGELVNK